MHRKTKNVKIHLLITGVLSICTIAFGHNGTYAYAFPMDPVVVDGNLNEWHSNQAQIPLRLIYGPDKPKNSDDLSASFRIGYNKQNQALYIALEVTDDEHITDYSGNANWASVDNHILYLDEKHSMNNSGVISYLFGDSIKLNLNTKDSWDPSVRTMNWDNVEIATRRIGNTTTYEWSVGLEGEIHPYNTFGLDHMVIDPDAKANNNMFTILSWGKGDPKHISAGFLGDIILLHEGEELFEISGQTIWKNDKFRSFPEKIKIESMDKEKLWFEIAVDSFGNFKAKVPEGKYRIKVPDAFFYTENNDQIRLNNNSIAIDTIEKSNLSSLKLVLERLERKDFHLRPGWLFDFDGTNRNKLDTIIKYLQYYHQVPGISMAIVRKSGVVYKQDYGLANIFTEEPVENSTLFEAASISKPVFAFCVLRLAEKGLIDLNKPLFEYLPLEGLRDEGYKVMTAIHVLSHRSGLPNFGKRLYFEPGTRYGYSGEAFDYLRKVVEHILDKDIETILQEEVMQPIGMENTCFSRNKYLEDVVATGHTDRRPGLRLIPDEPGVYYSMYTNANEFAHFVMALMNRDYLDFHTYKHFYTRHTKIPEDKLTGLGWDEYFGLGIHLMNTSFGNEFGHGGNNGDFQCQFEIYDDKNTAYIIFTNSSNGMKLINSFREIFIIGK